MRRHALVFGLMLIGLGALTIGSIADARMWAYSSVQGRDVRVSHIQFSVPNPSAASGTPVVANLVIYGVNHRPIRGVAVTWRVISENGEEMQVRELETAEGVHEAHFLACVPWGICHVHASFGEDRADNGPIEPADFFFSFPPEPVWQE